MSILLLYTLAFAIMFGAAIGSFLNVVIYRVPAGLSVVHPPSRCPKCETRIAWYDNLPILSWLILRGKCRHCKTPISPRYALVELLTASLSGLIWWMWASQLLTPETDPTRIDWAWLMVPFFLRFTFIALLIVITFVDLDHFIIPHVFTIPGMIVGLATPWIYDAVLGHEYLLFIWPPVTPWTSLTGFIFGGLIVVFVFYLYLAARGVEGMGGGDVTLMAMVGAWLGWPALVFIFFAASVQGLVAAGVAKLFGLAYLKDGAEVFADDQPLGFRDPDAPIPDDLPDTVPSGKLAVPFGPFIALAAAEFLLFGPWLPPEFSLGYMYY
ncbi:MAG: prepilin peptidase [bacterium]